jgi:uncharacterized membrane protein (UPF0127 family)
MNPRQRARRPRTTLVLAATTTLLAAGLLLTLQPFSTAARAGSAAPCATASSQGTLDADPTYVRLTFTNQCGQPVQLAVDIAADIPSQERGLMNVQHLPADQGELFDMANMNSGTEVQESFWMEDTLIPLSIAFVGRDATVHEIQDMAASTTDLHTPSQPYLYAVEANRGWFASHQIMAGSRVDLTSALAVVAGSSTTH